MLPGQYNTELLTETWPAHEGYNRYQMIKKNIFESRKAALTASSEDRLHRFVMADKMLRGAVVKTTRMVNEMQANHELGNLETLVLGQAYIATALMCSLLKGKDRISIQLQCDGPVGGLDVEGNGFGEIRGFLKNPRIQIGQTDEIQSLSSLFGDGYLVVTRYLEDAPSPYSGKIKLAYKTLAQDLANYYVQSEQIPTALRLNVYFDSEDKVAGAGGIFLQALPGVTDEQISLAESILEAAPPAGEYFAVGMDPVSLIQNEFKELQPSFLSNTRVEFFCRCSKEKMAGHVKNLPGADLEEMIQNGPFPLETRCHHCNSVYTFDKQELQNLAR